MKKINGKYYAMVNIKQSGSFMVTCDVDLEEDDIYGRCLDNDLMDAEDVDFADIDTLIDDYDIKGMSDATFDITIEEDKE